MWWHLRVLLVYPTKRRQKKMVVVTMPTVSDTSFGANTQSAEPTQGCPLPEPPSSLSPYHLSPHKPILRAV